MASWPFRRLGKVVAALVLFAAVIGLATAAAWSLAGRDLAATAMELDETDLTIGSAAVTRAATAQAVVFAVDNANGTVSNEALAAAIGEATANLDAYDQLREVVQQHESPPAAAELAGLSTQGAAVVDLLAAGEVESARAISEAALENEYQVAVAALSDERTALVSTVASARDLTRNTATAVRLAVILGLPALVLTLVWGVYRRRITRARRESRADLEAASERVERMEEMLLAVSHRLRTPLTSIYGLSDVLVQTKRIQGLDRELVTLINSESANLHRVAEDVLTATQLDSGRLELDPGIVSLLDVLGEVVKPLRAAGVDITVDCPEVWVLSDEPKLRQILRNLVSNAVQHGAEPVAVSVVESDGAVRCTVTDHGPGPAEGTVSNGAGRGLDVAYRLADLIGVTVVCERRDGATHFSLTWSGDGPQTPELEVGAAAASAPESVPEQLDEERVGTGHSP